DQVEAAVLEGEALEPGLLDRLQAPLAAEAHRLRRGIDPDRPPHAGVALEVAAGPAAGVEDLGRWRQAQAADQRLDHRPAAPEPPVAVLELEVLSVGGLSHVIGPDRGGGGP